MSRSDDIDWTNAKASTGELDGYSGRFVAVLNGRMLDVGDDGVALRNAVCKKHGVSPARLLIYFIPDGTE